MPNNHPTKVIRKHEKKESYSLHKITEYSWYGNKENKKEEKCFEIVSQIVTKDK